MRTSAHILSSENNIIYQDNKSAILLETNGRWSSSGRTKHVKARYFYVKHNGDHGDVEIHHSPADALFPEDRMWADVLTKPKNGRAFLEEQSVLMNCPLQYKDDAILDDVEISGGSAKPDVYVWTKTGGSGSFPKQKARTLKSRAQFQPPSPQECVDNMASCHVWVPYGGVTRVGRLNPVYRCR